MSGIAGIIRFDGGPVEAGQVERMTSAMAHRGPDGIRHWVRGPAALGHGMLCTTPESLEERQPLANDDESLVLVMDGRVDNWEELRRELLGRGARLRNRSDAELVLRAYKLWGRELVHHLDGDFAFAVWDARRRALICVRDRIGHKPFYYHWDGRTFAFASESRALMALPWIPAELNHATLAEHLANEWHSREETFWNGVKRLVAAHRMDVGPDGPRTERYWAPDLSKPLPHRDDKDNVEHYRWLITDVVRRMSRSHRPLAFDVSGGLDSSALFATAEHLRRDGTLPAPGLTGYTLDFHNVPDADEVGFAGAVGDHLGIPVCRVPPSQKPMSWYRHWADEYREFPGYPNGAMSLDLRKAASSRGCRVSVSGVGGDQWLGGEDPGYYYAEELAQGAFSQAGACALSDIRSLGLARAFRWMVWSGLVPLAPEALKRFVRRAARRAPAIPAWLTPELQAALDVRRKASVAAVEAEARRRSQLNLLDTLGDAYIATAIEHEERMCASLQLELRAPYHSAPIVELAFSMPERLRSLGRTTRRCHRQAMAGRLPAMVLERSTKADFMVVFQRGLDAIGAGRLCDIAHKRREWVEPAGVARMLDCRREPAVSGWAEWRLWTLAGCDALL
jgi:asparagine synthase (glutamine-hydrolysing)